MINVLGDDNHYLNRTPFDEVFFFNIHFFL